MVMAVVRGAFTSHGGELGEELYRGRKGHDVRTQRLSPVRLGIAGARPSLFLLAFAWASRAQWSDRSWTPYARSIRKRAKRVSGVLARGHLEAPHGAVGRTT